MFDVSTWSPVGRLLATREDHDRSLQMLRRAKSTGEIIRFGAVGRGFAAVADATRCEVASRALVPVLDEDGTWVVYSVFREP